MQRVIVQADHAARMQADDILTYNVRNSQRPAGAVVVLRPVQVGGRPDADRRLQLLPVGAHQRLGQARLHQRRRDRRDGAARRRACRAASATNGPASRCRRSSPARRRRSCSRCRCCSCSCCLRRLYESWTIPLAVLLTVPLGILGAVLAVMLRGLPNDVYFTIGAGHDHRPRRQGRHPDHRVRQGPARAGQIADRGHDRGLPPALPADPDDRPRLHASASRRW